MRNSYILRSFNGQLVLLPAITDQLAIERNSKLYGVTAMERDELLSFILSPIPTQFWGSAYRLQVFTAREPGSLAAIARTLSDHSVNVLSSWAAAISSPGELSFTAIITLPPNNSQLGEPATANGDLAGHLHEVLARDGVLSRSELFQGESPLKLVRIVKLRILERIGSLYGKELPFELELTDAKLDLKEARSRDGRVIDALDLRPDYLRASIEHVLVTPDTEERYLKFAFLPAARYRRVSIRLSIESQESKFDGYYATALKALADKRINVFGSNNSLLAKEVSRPDAISDGLEKARFTFLVDISRSDLTGRKQLQEDDLFEKMTSALDSYAKLHGGRCRVERQDFGIRELSELPTPVFLASNVKKNLDPAWIDFALRVIRRLKERGLHPVNVDVSVEPSLLQEVHDLLNLCPLVVSLYLPEKLLRMSRHFRPRHKGRGEPRRTASYAPSDYTMYEEAYARIQGRPIIRLRHRDVFGPRYIGDQIEYPFDETDADRVLEKFDAALLRVLSSARYTELYQECSKRAAMGGGAGSSWIARDLEEWLEAHEQPERRTKVLSSTRRDAATPGPDAANGHEHTVHS